MLRLLTTLLARSRARVLLALLVPCFVAPRVAEAGCAGYVQHGFEPALSNLEISTLTNLNSIPATDLESKKSTPPRGNPPCTSVLCSGNSSLPTYPLVVPPESAGRWALQDRLIPLEEQGAEWLRRREPQLRPIISPPSIFHPPRLAALPLSYGPSKRV